MQSAYESGPCSVRSAAAQCPCLAEHREMGAPAYDVVTALPFIRDCLFSDVHPDEERQKAVEGPEGVRERVQRKSFRKDNSRNPFQTPLARCGI